MIPNGHDTLELPGGDHLGDSETTFAYGLLASLAGRAGRFGVFHLPWLAGGIWVLHYQDYYSSSLTHPIQQQEGVEYQQSVV
jgi:hypothetical protein